MSTSDESPPAPLSFNAHDHRMRQLLAAMPNNESAAAELYKTMHGVLCGYARVRGYTDDVAQQAFQETMIAVWQNALKFEGKSLVTTWVTGIFRRQLINVGRSDKSNRTTHLDDTEWLALENITDSGEPDVFETVSRQQIDAFLKSCLAKLKKTFPELVWIIEQYTAQLSIAEIAQMAGKPEGTIKRKAHEARQKLAKCLSVHGVTGSGD
jgi:RNA polymerase sigma factor (sigma-70 family)